MPDTSKKKEPVFPNEYFNSQGEYFKFTSEHRVFGTDAYALKKAQLKKKK